MFHKLLQRFLPRTTQSQASSFRRLRFEQCEERRMLAKADIVFLVDESGSTSTSTSQEWLRHLVTGDADMDGINSGPLANPGDTESLAERLDLVGIDDVRYGIVGYGEGAGLDRRYSHSQLFASGDDDSLFGDPTSASSSGPNDPFVDTTALNTIFGTAPTGNLKQVGGDEDGWDAIEHAIAEYKFRDGAAVFFVLVQNDEGRVVLNTALTDDGILSAINSVNGVLNVITTGGASSDEFPDIEYYDLFHVDAIAANQRVLGVEADLVGTGLHRAHTLVDGTSTRGETTFDDNGGSLDEIRGELPEGPGSDPLNLPQNRRDNGAGGETEKAYVRLAWDTGGAAWDIGVLDNDAGTTADQTFRENALRDAFVESLGEQILRAHARGDVYRDEYVFVSLNLGEGGQRVEGFAIDSGAHTIGVSANPGNSIEDPFAVFNVNSNAIPLAFGTTDKVHDVFRTGRTAEPGQDNLHVTINFDRDGIPLRNGSYVVELFFADIGLGEHESRIFDVKLEGVPVLDSYDIFSDQARIDENYSSIEHDTIQASSNTGVVKRFVVDVRGSDGLQIDLIRAANSDADPILNAVRIIDAGPARIEDIIISGSNSVHDAYSFSEAFSQGIHQFQTVPVGGADTIEVVFSEWVSVRETYLSVIGSHTGINYTRDWNIVDFAFDEETLTARWRFDDPNDGGLDPDPFPADILNIGFHSYNNEFKDIRGQRLDADWAYTSGLDQPSATSFPSGDGVPGGSFFFTLVILPGDHDLDNKNDGTGFPPYDSGTDNTFTDGDFDGDGDVDVHDYSLWQATIGIDLTARQLHQQR